MLKAKALLGYFWGEAVSTVVHILNSVSTRALDGKTSFKAWHGEIPQVHYFRMFGSVAHVKNTRPNLKKLDDRSRGTIFVGYEGGSKAYRCYDPVDQRVIVSCNIVFNEPARWHWGTADGEQEGDLEPFTVEHSVETTRDIASVTPSPPPPSVSLAMGEHATPGEIEEGDLDVDHDDAPLRVCAIDDIIKNAEVPEFMHHDLGNNMANSISYFELNVGEAALWHSHLYHINFDRIIHLSKVNLIPKILVVRRSK
jgi:hypothetical protein